MYKKDLALNNLYRGWYAEKKTTNQPTNQPVQMENRWLYYTYLCQNLEKSQNFPRIS